MRSASNLAAEIAKLGPFELLCDSNPETGIPTVTWRIREGADPGYTLFDLADRLRARLAGTRVHPHRNGIVGHLPQDLWFRIQLPERADVSADEQRL